MPPRSIEIKAFLDRLGWGTAMTTPLRGDFSTRRYVRLTRSDGATRFLMDADADQKTEQFVSIDLVLRGLGIHAPEIFGSDPEKGLILMEDLGQKNIGALLDAKEPPLPYFFRATEVLAKIHDAFVTPEASKKPLPLFNADVFATQAELFLDAYFPVVTGRAAAEEERLDFQNAWKEALLPLDALPKSLLLRDYMPDNLMDLPHGEIGVLDFQDGGIGPVAYDLASLCEEVRRTGGWGLLESVLAHYRAVSKTSLSEKDLLTACTTLSAQRHIRILGIIARLSSKGGPCDKRAFLPRIRDHLRRSLSIPSLRPVSVWFGSYDGLLE